MTRTQAERKAMELYPVKMQPGFKKRMVDTNARLRAAFMQCFDLMTTGSLPMTREECKEWIEKKYQEIPGFIWNTSESCLALYDHLASLSSAEMPNKSIRDHLCAFAEYIANHLSEDHVFTLTDQYLSGEVNGIYAKRLSEALSSAAPGMRWVKASDRLPDKPVSWRFTDLSNGGLDILTDGIRLALGGMQSQFIKPDKIDWNDIEWLDESSAPAPVGVTREDAAQEYAKKYGTLGHRETARKAYIAGMHFTAPVSSAAQPATGIVGNTAHGNGGSFCQCRQEDKTGQTGIWCCNCCGLPDEEFWKPTHLATGYSEDQVREAIRLAHQLNGYRAIKFTADEIISSLKQKP